jgi:serine/threonine-protein kinase RsbW
MAGEQSLYVVEGVAVPDSLDLLHDLMERVGSDHPDVLSEDLSMLETAVIEIAGNLIEHGRPAGGVDYRLSLEVLLDRLEGMLSDGGEALPMPPLDGDMPDPFSEAGRGILIAQAVLDELTYERTAVANTWRMVRQRH